GTYDVWAVGRFGITNPRLLTVSRGLKEVVEVEPKPDAADLPILEIESAVSGVSDGDGDDRYRIDLKHGRPIVLDLQAQRIDSPMDGSLTLLDPAGRLVALNADALGRDPLLAYTPTVDGPHRLIVSDLTYRGGFVYRLIATEKPYVVGAAPKAAAVGVAPILQVFGPQLGGDAKPLAGRPVGRSLDVRTWTAPPVGAPPVVFQFLDHPAAFSGLPTAATFGVAGVTWRPIWGGDSFGSIAVLPVSAPPTPESEPNDYPLAPQPLTLPAVVDGRFDAPRDRDWFAFRVPEGQGGRYVCEVFCARLGVPADPYFVWIDETGRDLGEHDDFGARAAGGFHGLHRDPRNVADLQPGKAVRVVVQERNLKGGPEYAYVLRIARATARFEAAATQADGPAAVGTSIRRGGTAHLEIVVQDDGLPNVPLKIVAKKLPPGVSLEPGVVHGERGVAV
ncbi:MAG: hypothetical protein ACRDD1_19255, partial [Planctomycetia bacterium]